MHNLHFIVVRANSGEEACRIAENEIFYWGDENNWRTFLGAISEKDNFYNNDPSYACDWKSKFGSIAKINAICNLEINRIDETLRDAFDLVVRGEAKSSNDWWKAGTYCREVSERLDMNLGGCLFDVLKNTYKSGKYDEFGVTNFNMPKKHNQMKWVVVLDMHS